MWTANQIYTLPHPKIMEAFKSIKQLENKMFLVTDLEGIQSDWTRNLIFSEEETEYSNQRNCLPKDGLLAIAPKIYGTGYSKDDDFWQSQNIETGEKWLGIEGDVCNNPNLQDKDFNENHLKLFNYLDLLNKETSTPIFFYNCEMWGGTIDMEIAIVFDNGCYIYLFDIDDNTTLDVTNNKLIDTSPLQKGFEHLGVNLPTYFFALHETSFNWKRYQL